jgi:hypothetical protein
VLSYFESEKIDATLRVYAAGSRTKGQWTEGLPADTPVRIIAPQPVNANELQQLPSGDYVRNWVKTWLPNSVDPGTLTASSNRILIGSVSYRVYKVENRATLGNYYKAFMAEEKANEYKVAALVLGRSQ